MNKGDKQSIAQTYAKTSRSHHRKIRISCNLEATHTEQVSDQPHEHRPQDPLLAPHRRKGSSAEIHRRRCKHMTSRRRISPALLTATVRHQHEDAPDYGRKEQTRQLSSPLADFKWKHFLRTPRNNGAVVPLQQTRSRRATAKATTEPPQKLQQPRNSSWTQPPTPEQRNHEQRCSNAEHDAHASCQPLPNGGDMWTSVQSSFAAADCHEPTTPAGSQSSSDGHGAAPDNSVDRAVKPVGEAVPIKHIPGTMPSAVHPYHHSSEMS